MTYHSVIRNFANIGMAQAEELRALLSLSMPAEMLKFCGNYYKTNLKRDPYVDELKMLDLLVTAREREGTSFAVTELLTNDAFVARTYADLLKKRKQLYPNLNRPMTFGEAANIAGEYIRRARGNTVCSTFLPSVENTRDSITYPDKTCVAAPKSAFRLRLLPFSAPSAEEGDKLVLVLPSAKDTPDDFRRNCASVLGDSHLMQYVKWISKVGNGGILKELLRITDGATVNLASLSLVGTSIPTDALCDGFVGSYILLISPHQWRTVCSLIQQNCLRACLFATIDKDSKFVFLRDKNSSFTIDSHFLHSLNRYTPVCAKLADEADLQPNSISFGGIGGGKCAYLAPDLADGIGEVVNTEVAACSAVCATPTNAYYKTALWSVLAPVTALCANGVAYSNQALSLALEFPAEMNAPEAVGSCTATLLGLYRAQAELALAAAGKVSIRADKDLKPPSISVWATAREAKKTPCTFTKSGNFVYAVSPVLDKDRLPDFAALRQLLDQITKLANEGKISSCRVLTCEAITDGIRKMSDTHTCLLSDVKVAADGNLPLCILIESGESLPFHRVGKVHPYRRLPQDTVEIPECTSRIMSYQPEIVIVSSMMDNDAMALAAYLEDEWGAHVSLFSNPADEAVNLSRAILTAQTLILCPNAILPKKEYVDFALDTLHRAGGVFLSLSKNYTPEGFISVKNGIDAKILCKICPLFLKIIKKL